MLRLSLLLPRPGAPLLAPPPLWVSPLMSATVPTVSGARYTVKAVKAWTKPGASPVAAHCVPAGEGWTLSVQGYRIIRPDGATWRPSQPGYATQEEADAVAYRLNAPAVATLAQWEAENRAAARPCPDLAAWIGATRERLLSDKRAEREAAAVEVRDLFLCGVPVGSTGDYEGVTVTTTGDAISYAGRSPTDNTRWIGVPVRFSPVPGLGVVPVGDVAWHAVRL